MVDRYICTYFGGDICCAIHEYYHPCLSIDYKRNKFRIMEKNEIAGIFTVAILLFLSPARGSNSAGHIS